MALPKSVTGYRWLDKDPIIDAFRYAKDLSGMTHKDISDKGGPTISTLDAWDKGETRKPQHITMVFAMDAMGFSEEWINKDGVRIRGRYDEKPGNRTKDVIRMRS